MSFPCHSHRLFMISGLLAAALIAACGGGDDGGDSPVAGGDSPVAGGDSPVAGGDSPVGIPATLTAPGTLITLTAATGATGTAIVNADATLTTLLDGGYPQAAPYTYAVSGDNPNRATITVTDDEGRVTAVLDFTAANRGDYTLSGASLSSVWAGPGSFTLANQAGETDYAPPSLATDSTLALDAADESDPFAVTATVQDGGIVAVKGRDENGELSFSAPYTYTRSGSAINTATLRVDLSGVLGAGQYSQYTLTFTGDGVGAFTGSGVDGGGAWSGQVGTVEYTAP